MSRLHTDAGPAGALLLALCAAGCSLSTGGSLTLGDADASPDLPQAESGDGTAGDVEERREGDAAEPPAEAETEPADAPGEREADGTEEPCECDPDETDDECTTSCDSTGERECGDDCRWGPCQPDDEDERCDWRDDDCDVNVDEDCDTSIIFPDPHPAGGTTIRVETRHNRGVTCVGLSVTGTCESFTGRYVRVEGPDAESIWTWYWDVDIPRGGVFHFTFSHKPGCDHPCPCLTTDTLIEADLAVAGSTDCG